MSAHTLMGRTQTSKRSIITIIVSCPENIVAQSGTMSLPSILHAVFTTVDYLTISVTNDVEAMMSVC